MIYFGLVLTQTLTPEPEIVTSDPAKHLIFSAIAVHNNSIYSVGQAFDKGNSAFASAFDDYRELAMDSEALVVKRDLVAPNTLVYTTIGATAYPNASFFDLVIDPNSNSFWAVGRAYKDVVNGVDALLSLININSGVELPNNGMLFNEHNTTDSFYGVTLDSYGNVYATGKTTDITNGLDPFIVKYNSNTGSTVWQKSYGVTENDQFFDIISIIT